MGIKYGKFEGTQLWATPSFYRPGETKCFSLQSRSTLVAELDWPAGCLGSWHLSALGRPVGRCRDKILAVADKQKDRFTRTEP